MRCRVHQSAWSTATLVDGVFETFIVPFGPLLLLSYLNATSRDADAGAPQGRSSWAAVGRLWSQVWQCGKGEDVHSPYGEHFV